MLYETITEKEIERLLQEEADESIVDKAIEAFLKNESKKGL